MILTIRIGAGLDSLRLAWITDPYVDDVKNNWTEWTTEKKNTRIALRIHNQFLQGFLP